MPIISSESLSIVAELRSPREPLGRNGHPAAFPDLQDAVENVFGLRIRT